MPCLARELGPVAAKNVKVGARLANTLKMGFAARDVAEFQDCAVILICAPGSGVPAAVDFLLQSPIRWKAKVVLFCLSNVASVDFPRFHEFGAFSGTLNEVSGLENHFVIEGAAPAVREAKRLLKDLKSKRSGVRHLEVNQDGVRLFEAARTLSGSLFTPLVNSCFEWVRESGVESKEAARLTEKMLLWTLRSYLHSGRRGWTGVAATRDWAAIGRQYEAVKKLDALQGDYFLHTAQHAIALYESYPGFSRNPPKQPEEE
jgi:hypothetical protein